jgi:hypothetical protein
MSTIRLLCEAFAKPRAVLLLGSLPVVAAILLAPVAAASFPAVSVPIYQAFAALCHQSRDRCWELLAQPFPVCVRCLGVYAGILAAAMLNLPFCRRAFLAATAVMATTWALEFFGVMKFPEGMRFFSGVAWGLTASSALSPLATSGPFSRTPASLTVANPGGPQANWSTGHEPALHPDV